MKCKKLNNQCFTETFLFNLFAFMLSLFLVSCSASQERQHVQRTMKSTVAEYNDYAAKRLTPYFKQAGVHYPPRQLALIAFKDSKKMELYARDKGAWRYIKSFPILAASGRPGPKLHRNDLQVPEGIYRIVAMNPNSRFDLSLKLDYPNRVDQMYAKLDGRRDLGNNIFIHGSHYSAGCLAMGDDVIEQLFELVYWVGIEQVRVIIAPNDLRHEEPLEGLTGLDWLPNLYASIKEALKPFHE